MAKYKTHTFHITTQTNLHAGSGDSNYGVIDKSIQRDPATGIPSIFSSSLKGAIREYCETEVDMDSSMVKHIFGDRPGGSTNSAHKGSFRFLPAYVLSVPMRSNQVPFYHTTADYLIENYETLLVNLKGSDRGLDELQEIKIDGSVNSATNQNGTLVVEGKKIEVDLPFQSSTLGQFICKMDNQTMIGHFKNGLPVIARNQLENGESKNLWYEEVLPRLTKLFFFIQTPEGDKYSEAFINKLHNHVIQIGANATVGYGYCKIEEIK